MNDLQTLLSEIGKRWGWEVGDKIKAEISAVVGATDVDIQQLQSAIQTIQGLLDADPGTPEFDVGQNIVTQLSDHLSRITNLEGDVATLKGDDATVGSVAYAVKQERERAQGIEAGLRTDTDANTAAVNTLNSDETVEGSVAKKVKDAVDAEASARSAATSALQDEIDAVETGAGLNDDGTYTANADANYISNATSLKDADNKLDAAIKNVETAATQAAENAGAAAVATAKQYADDTFVKKADVAAISAATLASVFRSAMDCGFNGASIEDVIGGTGDCAQASGGDSGDNGDGAVI